MKINHFMQVVLNECSELVNSVQKMLLLCTGFVNPVQAILYIRTLFSNAVQMTLYIRIIFPGTALMITAVRTEINDSAQMIFSFCMVYLQIIRMIVIFCTGVVNSVQMSVRCSTGFPAVVPMAFIICIAFNVPGYGIVNSCIISLPSVQAGLIVCTGFDTAVQMGVSSGTMPRNPVPDSRIGGCGISNYEQMYGNTRTIYNSTGQKIKINRLPAIIQL